MTIIWSIATNRTLMSVDGRDDQLKSKLDIKLFAEKPELQGPVKWITTSR